MVQSNVKFDKRAYTIKEAAEYACVSRGIIEGWMASNLLPYEELPRKGKYRLRRIRKDDLDAFLEACRQRDSQTKIADNTNKPILLPRNT